MRLSWFFLFPSHANFHQPLPPHLPHSMRVCVTTQQKSSPSCSECLGKRKKVKCLTNIWHARIMMPINYLLKRFMGFLLWRPIHLSLIPVVLDGGRILRSTVRKNPPDMNYIEAPAKSLTPLREFNYIIKSASSFPFKLTWFLRGWHCRKWDMNRHNLGIRGVGENETTGYLAKIQFMAFKEEALSNDIQTVI